MIHWIQPQEQSIRTPNEDMSVNLVLSCDCDSAPNLLTFKLWQL